MLPKNFHRRFNYKSGHALKVTKLAMNPLICSYCHTGHWLQEHSNKISIIRQLLVQTPDDCSLNPVISNLIYNCSRKDEKIVSLNYKTIISIILHLCHNHLILLFQSYDATDAKNQKLLPRPVVLHTFAYLELVILKVGCVSIFIRCREAITTTTTTAREGRNLWTVHCKQCDQIGWFIGLWATF